MQIVCCHCGEQAEEKDGWYFLKGWAEDAGEFFCPDCAKQYQKLCDLP